MRIPTPWFPLLVLSAAIGYAGTTFDFSYQFAAVPGDTFGGTFTGTWNGSVVTVDSITSVWVNDPSTKYSAIVVGGWDVTVTDPTVFGWTMPPVMSPTLMENNFLLTNPNGFQFTIAPDGTGDVTANGEFDPASVLDYDAVATSNALDSPGVWTLSEQTPTSSVPDGGSAALMSLGSFAALALLRKRR